MGVINMYMAIDVKRRNDDPRKSVRNRRGPGQNPENAKVWKLNRGGNKKKVLSGMQKRNLEGVAS